MTSGLEVLWLDSGVVRLGCVPALGGRLLSVTVGGQECLWRNDELLGDDLQPVNGHIPRPVAGQLSEWNNYGGDKTWPAPQGWSSPGEWAGPPDPVLDSGPYSWALTRCDCGHERGVTMTSASDPRTGLTVSRSISIEDGSNAYDVTVSARNHSDRPVRWALWNVTQRDARGPGTVLVSVNDSNDPIVAVVVGTGVPTVRVVDDRRIAIDHQRVVGKVGVPGAAGWLAHISRGTTSTMLFEPDATATYPDEGSRVEIWLESPLDKPLSALGGLRPRADIVELEILGPLRTLQPREEMSLRLRCAVVAGEHLDITHVTRDGHRSGAGWTSYRTGVNRTCETGSAS